MLIWSMLQKSTFGCTVRSSKHTDFPTFTRFMLEQYVLKLWWIMAQEYTKEQISLHQTSSDSAHTNVWACAYIWIHVKVNGECFDWANVI